MEESNRQSLSKMGNKNAHIGKLRKIKRERIFTIVRKIQTLLNELNETAPEAKSYILQKDSNPLKS